MKLLIAARGYPEWHRKRVARLREGIAREDGHGRAHPASLSCHIGPKHGLVYDVEGNPHHLLMNIDDIFRCIKFLPAGEHLLPSDYHLVNHWCYTPPVKNGLQHAPPCKPGLLVAVGEQTFTKHQPQPDLLVGSFLDLEEGLLLFDKNFLGKIRMRYEVYRTW